MTSEVVKSIINITYNHLNLPKVINFSNNDRIEYGYSAAGTKLRRQVYTTGSLTGATDYVNGFVYENNIPSYMLFDEGRILLANAIGTPEYHIKDHLGNVRVSFTADGTVKQVNSYYPFGMNIYALTSTETTSTKNRYLYNGKEYQGDFGLNMLDYGARMYSAVIGRYPNPDLLEEKYFDWTPYNYVGNNPVKRIDIFGLDWYGDTDGSYQYNPFLTKKNARYILKEHQSYEGETVKIKDKNGTVIINYRKDGSIFFSNETDAYKRMKDNSDKYGGREVLSVLTNKGVLVLPDYLNDVSTSLDDKFFYSYNYDKNGNLKDPITGETLETKATLHTHLGKGFDVSPSEQDKTRYSQKTPYKIFMTMGNDGNIYAEYGRMINSVPNISIVTELLKGLTNDQLLKGHPLIKQIMEIKIGRP